MKESMKIQAILRDAAFKFADERNLTGAKRHATIITRGKLARVRFLNRASEREWVKHCEANQLPNSKELNF